MQSDGKILVAGEFPGHVARINADGTADASFTPPTGTFTAKAVVALPDGKVLLGGSGTLAGRQHLLRLNADGSVDNTFTLTPNAPVNALAPQAAGKVLVGGDFTNLGHAYVQPAPVLEPWPTDASGTIFPIGGSLVLGVDGGKVGPPTGLFRMDTAGGVDAGFGNVHFHRVTSLAVQSDGRIVAAGATTHRSLYWSNWYGYPDQRGSRAARHALADLLCDVRPGQNA